MFINDPNSPMYTNYTPNGALGQGLVPNQFHGMNTRYLGESVLGFGVDLFGRGGAEHLKDGFVFSPFTKRPFSGFNSAYKTGIKGAGLFLMPQALLLGSMAPKGRKAAKTIGVVAGTIPYLIGSVIGGPIGGSIAEVAVGAKIERSVTKAVSSFTDFERAQATPQLGGGYVDTQQALTMRQRAAIEISNSLLNARMHLGNEAMLYHQ